MENTLERPMIANNATGELLQRFEDQNGQNYELRLRLRNMLRRLDPNISVSIDEDHNAMAEEENSGSLHRNVRCLDAQSQLITTTEEIISQLEQLV